MKLAKSIKFDKSDSLVFERNSIEGDWAIPGGFIFSFLKEEDIVGKVKQAFSNGFFCLPSFGFSTFVCVASFSEKDFDEAINTLGNYMLLNYNAPSELEAMRVAKNELIFMSDICKNHELGSLLSINRIITNQGIKEEFRKISKPDSCAEQKIWSLVDDE